MVLFTIFTKLYNGFPSKNDFVYYIYYYAVSPAVTVLLNVLLAQHTVCTRQSCRVHLTYSYDLTNSCRVPKE